MKNGCNSLPESGTEHDSSANEQAIADHLLTTPGTDIAARVEHHADLILRAAGSGLRHYSMPGTRRAILSAVLALYEEAYRSGADFAIERLRPTPTKGADHG